MALNIALIALALIAPAKAQSGAQEIPRQFWGEYNEELAACGTGSNESRLRISWDTIQFYESAGALREIIRLSDKSIIVVADHTSEGQHFTKTYQLQLS
jgi:hypothetical protein